MIVGRYVDYLGLSARQLFTKRLRVLLTVLGIAIGVAAVIGIVAIGDGIREQAIQAIEAQSDLSLVEVHPDTQDGITQLITDARVDDIRSMDHVLAAAPAIRDNYATKKQTYLDVVAMNGPDFEQVLKPQYLHGEGMSPGTNEVVFGHDLRDTLQRVEGIRIGEGFDIVVRDYNESGYPVDTGHRLNATGSLTVRNDQFDRLLIMDLATAMTFRDDEAGYSSVFVRVDSADNVFGVAEQVKSLGLTATGAFEQIKAVNNFMDMVVMIFTLFAVFALLVGGLMIMTTMITSVFERTREIGITMAIGASEGDVVRLVMYECLLIGVMGGILGDLFGLGFATVVNTFGKPYVVASLGDQFAGIFGEQIAVVSPGLMLIGLAIAVVFSLGAGIYPAVKATRLNPVDAIRGT
ncbi:MAG: macrolide transporter ATP-binding /permease protein [Methanocella sp. PtaU1.Bin125]|nr:MAG: macrolide transporter ATP-binding /permease protein [Methanocella sp. PtaU1.Bin125]